VSKKLRCAFRVELAKCCPSGTCTRIGSRSGGVKEQRRPLHGPVAGLLQLGEAAGRAGVAQRRRVAVLERATLGRSDRADRCCGCPAPGSPRSPRPRTRQRARRLRAQR
jgi:hypothetical protein